MKEIRVHITSAQDCRTQNPQLYHCAIKHFKILYEAVLQGYDNTDAYFSLISPSSPFSAFPPKDKKNSQPINKSRPSICKIITKSEYYEREGKHQPWGCSNFIFFLYILNHSTIKSFQILSPPVLASKSTTSECSSVHSRLLYHSQVDVSTYHVMVPILSKRQPFNPCFISQDNRKQKTLPAFLKLGCLLPMTFRTLNQQLQYNSCLPFNILISKVCSNIHQI